MYPFISAKCIVLDENQKCYATITDIDENNNTFSVDYINPDTKKFAKMTNIPFSKFRIILYYVGLGWVKETYVSQWIEDGKQIITNDGIIRNWNDVKNGKTNLFIDEEIANIKIKNLELESIKRLKEAYEENYKCCYLCNLIGLSQKEKEIIQILFDWELREEFLKIYKTKTSTIGCTEFLFKSDNRPSHRQIRLDYLDYVIKKLEKDEK